MLIVCCLLYYAGIRWVNGTFTRAASHSEPVAFTGRFYGLRLLLKFGTTMCVVGQVSLCWLRL